MLVLARPRPYIPVMPMKIPLDELNEPQREAACHEGSPLLVLAGAGSGKTRVVTFRIARLILERGVLPGRILAVTFTNKAAREMAGRIEAMTGEKGRGLWIGTFHAMCARILRRHAEHLGYPKDFTIYDSDEQKDMLKQVIRGMNWDLEKWQPSKTLHRISFAKNHLLTPSQLAAQPRKQDDPQLSEIYARYIQALKDAGAMDFDDLLVLTNRLLEEHEEVRGIYQRQFEHVIVDEYQDTNEPQDRLTRLLASPQDNLCVVGDDDQSIYRWRGAKFQNILKLPEVYPRLKIIRLGENYRSTTRIVQAAQSVITHNRQRHHKDLHTAREEGQPVWLLSTENEEDEASQVSGLVSAALRDGTPPREIGVLYRTNAQSRVLEEAFLRAQIPYRIVGGLAFYQRKEIKTLLAYLRLLIVPHDDIAFLRIVNVPRRGIGQTTLRQLQAKAGSLHLSLFETAKRAGSWDEIGSGGAQKLQGLCLLLNRWASRLEEVPLARTLQSIVEETQYLEFVEKDEPAKAETRRENILELVTALQTAEMSLAFEEIRPWESQDSGAPMTRAQKLELFLEKVTLQSDMEGEEIVQDAVSLMTLHSAKGLEFSRVFITGVEEGVLPHVQSMTSEEELEEERRLCYVGITRAKDHLVMSHAYQRSMMGSTTSNPRSRFLDEIPPELVENVGVLRPHKPAQNSFFETPFGGRNPYGRGVRRYQEHRPPQPREPKTSPVTKTTKLPAQVKTPAPDFLKQGRLVRHQTFGIGRILSVEGEDPMWRVTVDFRIVGKKTVIQKYAKLEPA